MAKRQHLVLEPVDVQIHDVDRDNIGVGCG